MRRALVAAVLGAALLFVGTACDTTVTGELVSKEYEPRNCEKRKKFRCVQWDPAEHELTIKTLEGSEVELVVGKSTFDSAQVGTVGSWKGKID